MKIGIFHDYFGAIGGGEITVLNLAQILHADIITTDTEALSILNPKVPVLSIGKTIRKSPLKQISASVLFSKINYLDDYDFFVFTGNWSIHAATLHHPNLWYCYTPVRAFYDNYHKYLHGMSFSQKPFFASWVAAHCRWNIRAVKSVDSIISISHTVAERVASYLNRTSSVIYPPVDTKKYSCSEYGDFWLSVNRIYPEKRLELQIEAFRSLSKENLVIVGGYSKGDQTSHYARKILSDLPSNVTYLGEIEEEEVLSLYAHCKGHITTAYHEDFGLTPIESMASGKPVVAVNQGGYRETVTTGTGVLVPPYVSDLVEGVKEISRDPESYRSACLERASEFDIGSFSTHIQDTVNHQINKVLF
nr:glycosyltransferase [uncultured Methanospirillum sp.]